MKRRYDSILEIEQHNRAKGFHFFDPSTMRFFNSRIHDQVYGGNVFVTSEKGPDDVRRYTVRRMTETGRINMVGDFQQYASRSGAHAAAAKATN